MKRMRTKVLGLLLLVSLTETTAFAAQTTVDTVESARTSKKLGMYLGIGDPCPTVLGINLAYNVTDFLKASVGYGSISVLGASAKTLGAGIRGLVPGWNVSPTVGLHWAHVSYDGPGIIEVGGFKESSSHIYTTLGVDWQTGAGFNLNGGYHYSFKSGIGGGIYLGAGWFVNWLG